MKADYKSQAWYQDDITDDDKLLLERLRKLETLHAFKNSDKEAGAYITDISKDVYRTFPAQPYFSTLEGGSGEQGQKALGNILRSYAAYEPIVGYCQGMNFMAGFTLLVSGSRE